MTSKAKFHVVSSRQINITYAGETLTFRLVPNMLGDVTGPNVVVRLLYTDIWNNAIRYRNGSFRFFLPQDETFLAFVRRYWKNNKREHLSYIIPNVKQRDLL